MMCEFLNEKDNMNEFVHGVMEANEKMGQALAYIYGMYPGIKEEVLSYLAEEML